MNPHHGRDLARPGEPVLPVILRGDAWTARRIRNNCLRQHAHALASAFRSGQARRLKEACGRILLVLETRSQVLTHLHPNQLAVVAGAIRLATYQKLWLRAPEDWQPDPQADARAQWASLLRHLLARYPVPAFLDAAWERRGTPAHFERDCWCVLAAGESVRGLRGFPPSISARVLHEALTTQNIQTPTLKQALWLAQLRRLGAPLALKQAVLSSRVPEELGDHALWVRLVAKFAAGDPALTPSFALATEALAVVRAERGAAQVKTLLRLPLQELLRHCTRLTGRLLEVDGHELTEMLAAAPAGRNVLHQLVSSRWKPMLGGRSFTSPHGWQVVELCSQDELKREGSAMKHCVARYARSCRRGWSAIFSVRRCDIDKDGVEGAGSHATIEVWPESRRIWQVRSFRNLPVNNTIMNVVREWARAHQLRWTA